MSVKTAAMGVVQAKDFLVQEVTHQAALEHVPFSDLEKKLMYFSEMDIASCSDPAALQYEFRAHHDVKAYEGKVSTLLHHSYDRLKREERQKIGVWNQAIRVLGDGDHYLLVLWDLIPPEEHSTRDVYSWSGAGLFLGLILGVVVIVWLSLSGGR